MSSLSNISIMSHPIIFRLFLFIKAVINARQSDSYVINLMKEQLNYITANYVNSKYSLGCRDAVRLAGLWC